MSQGFLSVPGGGVRGIFLVLVILLCKFKKFELSPGGEGGICTQVCNELEFSSMLISTS